MDARREDVLDAPYFHLVFTVPDILNPIIYSNQKLFRRGRILFKVCRIKTLKNILNGRLIHNQHLLSGQTDFGILFPNKFTGNYLTVSTLEQVMRRAVSDADLPMNATPHCLRHSFATHLMEQGVERQNIQALLGHRDPKSTEVYLHVSNKSLMGIQSPFDRKEGADYE